MDQSGQSARDIANANKNPQMVEWARSYGAFLGRYKGKKRRKDMMHEIASKRAVTINDRSLRDDFPHRLDRAFHPVVKAVTNRRCQLCAYTLTKMRPSKGINEGDNRDNIVRCVTCDVNLCLFCFNEFHGVDLGE
uniref:Uncharacterized protein n=1 Tax=Helicotheca tamesis TaxID=374047 RepID=A0A7S2ME00_9STRA|mmetsp:Transcript_14411/g.19734  ORF Transcript_14411/g.19734 Transcript_14411/m.19734 type:complete len:135 (+) Transcript_14411:371-775(+)